MPSDQVEQRLEQLGENLKAAYDKLGKLELARVRAADEATRIKYDSDIEQTGKDIKALEQEYNTTEGLSSSKKLYDALLRLDYFEQARIFRQFSDRSKVAAFLIHGEPQCGQRWLLNRLARKFTLTASKTFKIDLTSRVHGASISKVWRQLGGFFGANQNASPNVIAECVRTSWKTQPVVMIFNNVDQMPEDYLREFVGEFWCPLVKDLHNSPSLPSDHPLLMFLVDNGGDVDAWDITFAVAVDDKWCLDVPVKLPGVRKFTAEILAQWIQYETEALPTPLINDPSQAAADILVNSEDGIPEEVLAYICAKCNFNWYEGESKWCSL